MKQAPAIPPVATQADQPQIKHPLDCSTAKDATEATSGTKGLAVIIIGVIGLIGFALAKYVFHLW